MIVTSKKIKFKGNERCKFPGCKANGKEHSHNRYNELGWDLSNPNWWTRYMPGPPKTYVNE